MVNNKLNWRLFGVHVCYFSLVNYIVNLYHEIVDVSFVSLPIVSHGLVFVHFHETSFAHRLVFEPEFCLKNLKYGHYHTEAECVLIYQNQSGRLPSIEGKCFLERHAMLRTVFLFVAFQS